MDAIHPPAPNHLPPLPLFSPLMSPPFSLPLVPSVSPFPAVANARAPCLLQGELDEELDALMEEDLEEQMLRVNAPGGVAVPGEELPDAFDALPSVPQSEIEEQRQLEELEAVWN